SWIRRDGSAAISTVAFATALRRETGLWPTSTILTSPEDSSTCERSVMARSLVGDGQPTETVEVGQLVARPRPHVVLAHVLLQRLRAAVALSGRHRQRLV